MVELSHFFCGVDSNAISAKKTSPILDMLPKIVNLNTLMGKTCGLAFISGQHPGDFFTVEARSMVKLLFFQDSPLLSNLRKYSPKRHVTSKMELPSLDISRGVRSWGSTTLGAFFIFGCSSKRITLTDTATSVFVVAVAR